MTEKDDDDFSTTVARKLDGGDTRKLDSDDLAAISVIIVFGLIIPIIFAMFLNWVTP